VRAVTPPLGETAPWTKHRRRAEVLRERHPFAAEVLTLYLELVPVWQDGWRLTREQRPAPARLAAWAAEQVLPAVVAATEAAGPEPLAKASRDLLDGGELGRSLSGWLAGGSAAAEIAPVERYLARATLRAPLVALEADAAAACAPVTRSDRTCPRCGGAAQLSVRSAPDDPLVTGARQLLCGRCDQAWAYSGSSCPGCGETTGSRRTIYAEQRSGPVVGRLAPDGNPVGRVQPEGDTDDAPTFPHLRIDACASCERYVIDVDLGRDPRAVPEVDELAALPLDLYAAEQGLSKITPNLMGF
jgi:FdhE protein